MIRRTLLNVHGDAPLVGVVPPLKYALHWDRP